MKKILILLFIFILLLFPINTEAYEIDIELGKTFGEIEHTTSIQGSNLYSQSTLPLDSTLLKINFNQYIFKDWADYYSITLGSNFFDTSTKEAEIINYTYDINNKESKLSGNTTLENFYLDFLLANYLLEYSTPKQSYLILIGYEYDNYGLNVKNGTYYDYSTNNHNNINNKISYHRTQYHIPYLGMILNRNINKTLKNRLVVKLSPYAYTRNSTQNYYDTYTGKSSGDGNYLFVNNKTRYNFRENMYFTGGLQYKILNTDGPGERYFYDGGQQGTKQDLETHTQTEEYNLSFGVEYLF
ncbi:MAG: hypothetical protein R6V14_07010 [Halanaerobiales bacterium]